MTPHDGVTVAGRRAPSAAALRRGGLGLLVGGVLQLLAEVRAVVPGSQAVVAPLWPLLVWVVGAAALLAGSVLLAVGRRGEDGVVGRRAPGRIALVVSGGSSLLLVVVSVLSLAAPDGPWSAAFTVVLLVGLVAAAGAAAAAVRAGVLTGPARAALVLLAAVDAADLVLQLVPPSHVAGLIGVFGARPALLAAAGLAVVLQVRSRPSRERRGRGVRA